MFGGGGGGGGWLKGSARTVSVVNLELYLHTNAHTHAYTHKYHMHTHSVTCTVWLLRVYPIKDSTCTWIQ